MAKATHKWAFKPGMRAGAYTQRDFSHACTDHWSDIGLTRFPEAYVIRSDEAALCQ